LANYNKFEFANPYRLRQEDFVDDSAISAVVGCVGSGMRTCRDAYLAVQDDQIESWNPIAFLSFGAFGAKPQNAPLLSEEEMKKAFVAL